MVGAKYNPVATSSGYGGMAGIGALGCRTGFTAVGKDCLVLPIYGEKIMADANVDCSNVDGATLFSPTDPTQNHVIRGLMKHWVRNLVYSLITIYTVQCDENLFLNLGH
jgi:hypothetical protein